MTKKHIFMIMIGFFLISIVGSFFIFHKKEADYTSSIENVEVQEEVSTILDQLPNKFRKEIELEMSARQFQEQFNEITHSEYPDKVLPFLIQAYEKLGDEFWNLYFAENSFEEILASTCGPEFEKFQAAYLVGDNENIEYAGGSTYELWLDKIATGQISSLASEVDSMLDSYKFTTEENYKMANLIHDVQLLSSIEEYGSIDDIELLEDIYDENVYLILTMKMYPEIRYDVIVDKNSPVIYDSTVITVIDSKREKTKDIQLWDEEQEIEISKITFEVEGKTFYARMMKNGKSWTCYDVKAKVNKGYKTIAEAVHESNKEIVGF